MNKSYENNVKSTAAAILIAMGGSAIAEGKTPTGAAGVPQTTEHSTGGAKAGTMHESKTGGAKVPVNPIKRAENQLERQHISGDGTSFAADTKLTWIGENRLIHEVDSPAKRKVAGETEYFSADQPGRSPKSTVFEHIPDRAIETPSENVSYAPNTWEQVNPIVTEKEVLKFDPEFQAFMSPVSFEDGSNGVITVADDEIIGHAQPGQEQPAVIARR